MYDMHIHTEFSPDSKTPLKEHIAAAERLGLKGLCVTDHMDIGGPSHPEHGMYAEDWSSIDFSAYLESICVAQSTTDMYIGAGVEVGIAEDNLDSMHGRIAPYEFDFIIASFHYYNGKDPFFSDFYEGEDLSKLFENYYVSALKCLKQDIRYSVIGHLTYLYKTPVPFDTDIAYADYPDLFDAILKQIIETGHGIEINTSSLRRKDKPMPSYDFIKRYRELGGEILTIGSDAHKPAHVGLRFEEVKEQLKAIGFQYACYFKGMKPEFYAI